MSFSVVHDTELTDGHMHFVSFFILRDGQREAGRLRAPGIGTKRWAAHPSTSWTFDCQESGVGVLTQTKAQWHHTKGILMSLLSNPKAGRLFPASLSTPSSKAASQLGAHSLPSCNFKMENTLPDTHSGRYIVLDR